MSYYAMLAQSVWSTGDWRQDSKIAAILLIMIALVVGAYLIQRDKRNK
jgi:hypothetical protein